MEKTTERTTENYIEEPTIVNETQVQQTKRNVTHTETTGGLTPRRVIYYLLGILEILFSFRLILKVLGANPESPFVGIIYSITNLFLAPFNGIFRTAVTDGIETESVLEPALIIAMIVYAALAWGLVRLIDIIRTRKGTETL